MSNIEPIDGRNARRAGSRAKLLKAGLRLIEKGDFRFSLQDVADRAQMHRRSIHDIFGDFDGYLHELVDEYEASIRAAVNEAAKTQSLARLVMFGKAK
jgi:AcrR family transcriptional regulator